jgi:glycogen debranching enzyme
LAPTVDAALDDLKHLLMTDPADPRDIFAAAGTPWYLTLFGRDSLWAARMMLPFGTDLARGTLRALARRQGTTVNRERAEDVGKIPHELRRTDHRDPTTSLALPAAYYGTVDATALWISLLHDAWRWGLPFADVSALLPNLEAALGWLTDRAVPDGDGLLKYIDDTGAGLANQGWKDSGDAIRWRDGHVAIAPIALVEAQAYAVEAATGGAALLEALGRPGAPRLLQWAQEMRDRVRARFWVGHDQPRGPWLGIAVDGSGRTVDGLASNMGHVLGTGTLDAAESSRVARTLTSEYLLDHYGIRTLASDNGGFNPIGYHTGSIWTHDTAICAWNLSRDGHTAEAAAVSRTLLASSVAFGHHWPELYAGSGGFGHPVPYPASCRPQAWASASAAVLLTVALGFEPNAPEGRLVLRPCRPGPFGELTVRGLRFAGQEFAVHCAADGTATVLDGPDGLGIETA